MKNAQVQLNETTIVATIIIVLLIIALVFYTRVQEKAISIQNEEASQVRAIDIARSASVLPELQCGAGFERSDCMDIDKLEAFAAKNTNYTSEYFDILSYSTITVSQIYPDGNTIILYNKIPSGEFASNAIQRAVSIYNSTSKTYALGVISVKAHFMK